MRPQSLPISSSAMSAIEKSVLRPVAVERQFLVSHAEDRRCGSLRREGVLRRNGTGLRGNGISKRKNGDGSQNDKAFHWYSPCFATGPWYGDVLKSGFRH